MINFQDVNGRQITFFHIPKTGGSTVLYGIFSNGLVHLDSQFLESRFFTGDRRLRFNAWHFNDGSKGNNNDSKYYDHFPYRAAKKLGYLVNDYSMAFVRNPWQRCVSAYLQSRRLQEIKPISFAEWLETVNKDTDDYWGPTKLKAQCEYLIDEQGKVAVNKIYKVEDVDIFEVFSGLLGKRLFGENVNVAPTYNYRSFYTDALIEKVAKIYAADIGLFGYSYG